MSISDTLLFRGHTRPINCAKFSPDGSLIASGSDDGHIFVGSITKKTPLCMFSARQGPVVALDWAEIHQLKLTFIVSAGADGTVKLWKRNQTSFSYVGMRSVFDGAIESMDVSKNMVAVTGGGRVAVLEISETNRIDPFQLRVIEPSNMAPDKPALARTVHFFGQGKSLMVGYLDAQLLTAWDLSRWKVIWNRRIATRIGNSAWEDETQTLLIWNLEDGIDIYRIDNGPNCVGKINMKIRRNMVIQLEFCNHQYFISGSDHGDVYIWNLDSQSPYRILHHSPDPIAVQTVTFYACQDGKLMIASASSESDDTQPTVCIWSSRDQFSTKPSRLDTAVVPIRTGYGTLVDLRQLWIVFISVMAGSLLTILMWYRFFH